MLFHLSALSDQCKLVVEVHPTLFVVLNFVPAVFASGYPWHLVIREFQWNVTFLTIMVVFCSYTSCTALLLLTGFEIMVLIMHWLVSGTDVVEFRGLMTAA
jgi:hypothetical protein